MGNSARQGWEKISAPFVWAADQLAAPYPKFRRTPEEKKMSRAARRGYFQALQELRERTNPEDPIKIQLHATNTLEFVGQVRAEIALCLNDRAPVGTSEVPKNPEDGVPAGMRYLNKNQITVTQAPALARMTPLVSKPSPQPSLTAWIH